MADAGPDNILNTGNEQTVSYYDVIAAYRGRGLAKLVKSVARRHCFAAGITSAYTSNDDENVPMLAVNNWLGYRRVQTELALVRTLRSDIYL